MATEPAPPSPLVLGIAADYHDAAAAVLRDGELVAAVQEERFTRRKHDPDLPVRSIAWCLEAAGTGPGDQVAVAYHGKPMTTYERILRRNARLGPRAFPSFADAVASWTGRKLWIGYRIERALADLGHRVGDLTYVEHHTSHAASAFFPSPFAEAAVVTVDGVGEWDTTVISAGTPAGLAPRSSIRYPHSLGLLYSTITAFCGFEVNDGESKLMGLAPYGRPTFEQAMRDHLVELRPDGSFRLDLRWFRFEDGRRMDHRRLAGLLGGPPRRPDEPLTQREADLACSIQRVLEDALLGILRQAHDLTGASSVCLAGGVALNCVANGRVLDRGPFERMWVQPAAGDAGGAVGAAMWHHHVRCGQPRTRAVGDDGMSGCALGPRYPTEDIAAWLGAEGIGHEVLADDAAVAAAAAADLAGGAIVGWFHGAMEFGPRALGHRSILADPRRSEAVTRINARIKRREGFRPLAPAVLIEHVQDLFERAAPSPYMLLTDQVRGATPLEGIELGPGRPDAAALLASVPSPIPACTHVDGSARLQTVDPQRHPTLHRVLQAFHDQTGCPALVNTSFNLAGEPIVNTPVEALATAVEGDLDVLFLGRCRISRASLRARVP